MRFNRPSGSLDTIILPSNTAAARSSSSANGFNKMAMANSGMVIRCLVDVTSFYHLTAGE